VTVAEYLSELVSRMHEMITEVEARSRALAHDPSALDEIGREMMTRWEAMLADLSPPPEMAALHSRLEEIAAGPVEDDFATGTLLELARNAEEFGLEIFPGVTADSMAESMSAEPGNDWQAGDDDWESRLRRSLEADGRDDVDEVVERMRELRGE
jgi:hypothetical protein